MASMPWERENPGPGALPAAGSAVLSPEDPCPLDSGPVLQSGCLPAQGGPPSAMQRQISGCLTRGQGSIEPELMHARFMCNLCGEALLTVISWGVINYTWSPLLDLE